MWSVATDSLIHGLATSLLKSCNNLLQQANIRMRSHDLRQLVDDKSVAGCQQACCKLNVQTCYQQACCKLFQQVVTSLQMTQDGKLYLHSHWHPVPKCKCRECNTFAMARIHEQMFQTMSVK